LVNNYEGYKVAEAKVVNAANVHDFNDFGKEELVTEKEFKGFEVTKEGLNVTLPAHSVVMMKLSK
ncbi:MAG: alpha-N-arabinofuranosidase, partial [Lachnospiraceae bacterium]|nr:alpha-N-arabinofuranosidase [Lachnospiraceae bacterium]